MTIDNSVGRYLERHRQSVAVECSEQGEGGGFEVFRVSLDDNREENKDRDLQEEERMLVKWVVRALVERARRRK